MEFSLLLHVCKNKLWRKHCAISFFSKSIDALFLWACHCPNSRISCLKFLPQKLWLRKSFDKDQVLEWGIFCKVKYCSSYQVSGQICVTRLGYSHQWSQAIGCKKLTSRVFLLFSPIQMTLSLTFHKLTVSPGKAVDLLIGVGRSTKDFFAIFFSNKNSCFPGQPWQRSWKK